MAEWAVLLAREVAPEEEELAPLMAEAFAAGGEARAELFATSGAVPGGFSVGDVPTVVPLVLQSLAAAAPVLLGALSSSVVGDLLGCIKTGLSVAEVRAKADATLTAGAARGAASAMPAAAAVPEGAGYAPLKRVIDTMSSELQSQGLNADQSDLVTLRVLRRLLEQPQDAAQFVGQLSGTAPAP